MIRFSSLIEHPIKFPVRENYMLTSASVAVRNGEILASVSAMDHYINPKGGYWPLPTTANKPPIRAAFNTTYLAHFDHNLEVVSAQEVETPLSQIPTNGAHTFRGFESGRLAAWCGDLWMTLCTSGTGATPGAEFYFGRIDENGPRFADVRRIEAQPRVHAEKNWMPEVIGDELRFHYRLGTLIDLNGVKMPTGGRTDLEDWNGGSQVIPYKGGALCVVHTYEQVAGHPWRRYSRQNFIKLDAFGRPAILSQPFIIQRQQLEIVIGLAYHPDGKRLILSYGREDAESADILRYQEQPFIATIDLEELENVI